jgi:hypothetical protein
VRRRTIVVTSPRRLFKLGIMDSELEIPGNRDSNNNPVIKEYDKMDIIIISAEILRLSIFHLYLLKGAEAISNNNINHPLRNPIYKLSDTTRVR